MKRILFIAGGIFALLLVAALTVPFLIPKEVYKAQIEQAATSALNREVQLTGDVSISVFPRIAASVGGVTVANPEGFATPNMIEAGQLRGSVKWLPLIQRRVEVQEIAFVDANVQLQKLADGRTNWDFGSGEDSPANDGGSGGSVDAAVDQARLTNASLSYRDDAAGTVYELKDLNLEASLQAMDKPLKAKADGIFQDETFDIALTLSTPEALTSNAPADISFDLDSSLGTATYKGTMTLGETPQLTGSFTAAADSLAPATKFAKLDLPYDLARLGKVKAAGSVSGPLSALQVTLDEVTQASDLMKTNFKGGLTLGEAPTITGDLALTAPSLAEVTKFAAIDLPVNVAPLGAANIKASLSGALTAPAIRFETLGLKSGLIDMSYTGGLALGDVPTLDGALKALLPNTGELVKQMGVDIPAEAALEKLQIAGNLKGAADALSLTGLNVVHTGALLNGSYTGNVGLGGDGSINGEVDASSNELRALLAAADVEMEPGDTLQTFSSKGAVTGTFKKFTFNGLTLTLDGIKATGNAGMDLSGERPRLTGTLDMGALDLSPFLAPADQEKKPQQPMQAWSKEPLDLAGLKAVDADLDIRTTTLTLGNVKLADARIESKLSNGKLDANLPSFQTFGGTWAGRLSLDASAARPALSFDMSGQSVVISSLLGTLAGFDKLTGTGNFTVTGASSGNSIDEIMRALDGKVSTKLSDGALKGLNVAQLVRSADSLRQALTTGSLQNLDFAAVLSPQAETDFTSFDAVFNIQDGVAQVDLMKLLNPVLGIDGTGQINLGGQSLDLRLATAIDKKGQGTGSVVQLNGIPVPVRLSGSWDKLKVSPDFTGIQNALAADLGSQIRDGLSGQLGGSDAGSVIGDIIGLPGKKETPADSTGTPATAPPTDTPETTTPAEPEQPKSLEDAAKDAARDAAKDALGGLFGTKKKTEPPKEEEPPAEGE
ncbi:MAG: AsmA family protein [Hyphomonas sp.]|uniref:AsmA family protein n=1 Tax=Hyphomonas sp. TaxID=87 RepID=UPI00352897B5